MHKEQFTEILTRSIEVLNYIADTAGQDGRCQEGLRHIVRNVADDLSAVRALLTDDDDLILEGEEPETGDLELDLEPD